MAKIDAVEESQKILHFVAQQCNLQEFLTQGTLSPEQIKQRSYAWLLDRVKQEFSSKMSLVEAYFTTSNEFQEFETCIDVLLFLRQLLEEVENLITEFKTEDFDDEEKGGMEDA